MQVFRSALRHYRGDFWQVFQMKAWLDVVRARLAEAFICVVNY